MKNQKFVASLRSSAHVVRQKITRDEFYMTVINHVPVLVPVWYGTSTAIVAEEKNVRYARTDQLSF